jgi:hypothetical protein
MPTYQARIYYRWRKPGSNQNTGSTNGTIQTQSRSESGVIADLKLRNPNLRTYEVIIDRLDWIEKK